MLDIKREVASLEKMTTGELRERYAEIFGEVPRSRHKRYLIRKIAWRLQANAEGDLSARARRRAEELADDADVRTTPPQEQAATSTSQPKDRDSRLPLPGTSLIRKYKGQTIQVDVKTDGFVWDGKRFQSLSAVAKAITGSHTNGFRFFKLEAK